MNTTEKRKEIDQRLQIVNWLEKQLFRVPPVEDEVSHLTFDMWRDLSQSIVSGEYRDLNKT